MTGSDHVAAFFALPILVSLRQAWDLSPKKCALLAVMLGAAVLTKYQAIALALAPILIILGRAVWFAFGPNRRDRRNDIRHSVMDSQSWHGLCHRPHCDKSPLAQDGFGMVTTLSGAA